MLSDSKSDVVVLAANKQVVKKLGEWTSAHRFDLRLRRGRALIDLRDVLARSNAQVALDSDHGVLTLLVGEDSKIDLDGLQRIGWCHFKDRPIGAAQTGTAVTISGTLRGGSVRVYRGGYALLAALFSWDHLLRMRREHEKETKTRK